MLTGSLLHLFVPQLIALPLVVYSQGNYQEHYLCSDRSVINRKEYICDRRTLDCSEDGSDEKYCDERNNRFIGSFDTSFIGVNILHTG